MIGMNTVGTRVNDFLGFFGFRGGQLGAMIDGLTGNDLGVLMNLQDAAWEAAMHRGTSPWERQWNVNQMASFGHMMAPSA